MKQVWLFYNRFYLSDKKAERFVRSNEVREKTIARAVVQNSVLNTNYTLKLFFEIE
jgi:hypothetical protein